MKSVSRLVSFLKNSVWPPIPRQAFWCMVRLRQYGIKEESRLTFNCYFRYQEPIRGFRQPAVCLFNYMDIEKVKSEVPSLSPSALLASLSSNGDQEEIIIDRPDLDDSSLSSCLATVARGSAGCKPTGEVVTPWKGQIVPMNDHSDKEAIVYTCPDSGFLYRFILHRRNHQKADNYACARCKSRKKYVRILIAGVYFLEDPTKLEHICHMNQEELRDARERSQDVKSREMLKERQKLAKRSLAFLSRNSAFPAQNGMGGNPLDQLDLSNIQHETPLFPVATIARLFGDEGDVGGNSSMQQHNNSVSPYSTGDEDECGDVKPSASSSFLDSLININMNQSLSGLSAAGQDEAKSSPAPPPAKMYKAEREMVQKSDAEPLEPISQPKPPSDVFSISLNRAIDSLLPEFRAKAETEILRFVYGNLYEKYGPK